MGVLPGILGSIQAAEVIKLIVGGGRTLVGRLFLFDAWLMRARELRLDKNPECPVCGKNPSIHELTDYELFCGLKDNKEDPLPSITARELKDRLDNNDRVQIIDIREPHERSMFKFERAIPVPFGQLVRRMDEFDPSQDLVFLCKIGKRSLYAIRALKAAGYQGNMLNLEDGYAAWASEVDPESAVY
jgi:adenylyltransferase/sulfurtransferase